ncbi:MAG: molybdopterin synthase sulfur carrier subunit [Planctomycetes bacterium]|nr:molybdopterin synthase sulfur carrier subunit [Planctomycetota bacterium]
MELALPSAVRPHCGGKASVELAAADVRALLAAFAAKWPVGGRMVCDEQGRPRQHLNLFVGLESIRSLRGLDTLLHEGDVVSIVPAVSGG